MSDNRLAWFTYHYKWHKINPIPERVSILHHVHDVYPTFQADHLKAIYNTNILLFLFNLHNWNWSINLFVFAMELLVMLVPRNSNIKDKQICHMKRMGKGIFVRNLDLENWSKVKWPLGQLRSDNKSSYY